MSTKKKILVVDNDERLLKVYTAMLKKAGFEVVTDVAGDEPTKLVNREKPDLIILDVLLPRKTGWEILAELKETESTKDVPVIMVSNIGSTSREIEAADAGAEAYLVKADISLQTLIEKINKILKNKH